MAKLGIYTTCYNLSHYLPQLAESIEKQTFKDWFWVVVDDHSTQDSPELDWIEGGYKTWVFRNEVNQGVAASCNFAMKQLARIPECKYFISIDADDLLKSETYLERAVNILDNQPDVGIVYGKAQMFDDAGNVRDWFLPEFNFPGILWNNQIFNSAVFRTEDYWKTPGYQSVPEHKSVWHDYSYVLSVLELGRKVVRLEDVVYLYRQNPKSMTGATSQDEYAIAHVDLWDKHSELYMKHRTDLFKWMMELQNCCEGLQAENAQLRHYLTEAGKLIDTYARQNTAER